MDHLPSPAVSNNSAGSGGLWGSRDRSCSCAQSIASCRSWRSGSAQSQVTDDDQETSSESKLSHEEEDAPCEDEDAEAGKGEVEVLNDGQVASNGEEDTLKSKTPSLALAMSSVRTRRLTQSPTPERRSSSSGGNGTNPAPRRACLPRTRVGHLSRKSSQPMKHSATRPSKELNSWTQISMLGNGR